MVDGNYRGHVSSSGSLEFIFSPLRLQFSIEQSTACLRLGLENAKDFIAAEPTQASESSLHLASDLNGARGVDGGEAIRYLVYSTWTWSGELWEGK